MDRNRFAKTSECLHRPTSSLRLQQLSGLFLLAAASSKSGRVKKPKATVAGKLPKGIGKDPKIDKLLEVNSFKQFTGVTSSITQYHHIVTV